MKIKLKKYIIVFILCPVLGFTQDVSNINLGFSLTSNLSLIQNKMSIPGLNVSLSYQINRNINAGVHVGYIYNSHKINFTPYSFYAPINISDMNSCINISIDLITQRNIKPRN